jgi:hypothetical protein
LVYVGIGRASCYNDTMNTDLPPMEVVSASDLYLLRLMRENALMAQGMANLRTDLRARDEQIASLKNKNAAQADAINHLTARVNAAEGRR